MRWAKLLLTFGLFGLGNSSADIDCSSWRAEVLRRQEAEARSDLTGTVCGTGMEVDKHCPHLRIEGSKGILVVSSPAISGSSTHAQHPMGALPSDSTSIHFIDLLWVEDQDGEVIAMRRPSPLEAAPATMVFDIPENTTYLVPYEHCNKHGMWKGAGVRVFSTQRTNGTSTTCHTTSCTSAEDDNSICEAIVFEIKRQYLDLWPSDAGTPKVDASMKHKPTMTYDSTAGTATITMSAEYFDSGVKKHHPMSPSDDKDTVHWIQALWAEDQAGNVIAMKEFQPTDPAPVAFTFDVPAGVTSFTSYEFCNKHGLYIGDTVTVGGGATASSTPGSCGTDTCVLGDVPRYAKNSDCTAMIADYKRRHENLKVDGTVYDCATSGSSTKHCPYVDINGTTAKAVVGLGASSRGGENDLIHPMTDDPSDLGANIHFIEAIWVEDQSGNVLAYRQLSPSEESPATLYFEIPEGTTKVRAYEYCNKHLMYTGQEENVDPSSWTTGARFGCTMQTCAEGSAVSACQAMTAEFYRRHGSVPEAAKNGTYDLATMKHEPYMTINGTTATVVVGGRDGATRHPMSPSDDELTVHFISHIYVTDEFGNLVFLCELLPTDPSPATCSFEVPPGVLWMRAFEYCNKHGLYQSEIVNVDPSMVNPSATRLCHRRECHEAQPSLSDEAIVSMLVEEKLQSKESSLQRLSTPNYCKFHPATFAIPKSLLTADHMLWVEELITQAENLEATQERKAAFEYLFPMLVDLGGAWYGLPEVLEHTGMTSAAGYVLRSELMDLHLMRFTARNLSVGEETLLQGVENPLKADTEELYLIDANFQMNWGHTSVSDLGTHYAAFYTPHFAADLAPGVEEWVDVTLCAKTHGWMGLGWLGVNWADKPHPMSRTDMNVVWIKDGVVGIDDRFAFSTEEPSPDSSLPNQRAAVSAQAMTDALVPALASAGIDESTLTNAGIDVNNLTSTSFDVDKLTSAGIDVAQAEILSNMWSQVMSTLLLSQTQNVVLNGGVDLYVTNGPNGVLGTQGKEWCPDAECSVGFTLVNYMRKFVTPDVDDAILPSTDAQAHIVYAFAKFDPEGGTLLEHIMSTASQGVLKWNRYCDAGWYFNEQLVACVPCERGTFRPATAGTEKCFSCPVGWYQNNIASIKCLQCPANFTTFGVGSVKKKDCFCKGPTAENVDGWYHTPNCLAGEPTVDSRGNPKECTYVGKCNPCPLGMICNGGLDLQFDVRLNSSVVTRVNDYCNTAFIGAEGECQSKDFCAEYPDDEACFHTEPLLKQQYMTLADDNMEVFFCQSSKACPGGFPGTCGARRDDSLVACASCIENSYLMEGECRECEAQVGSLPFVFLCFGFAAGGIAFTFFINKRLYERTSTSLTVGILFGTVLSSMQTLTTFASIEVDWIEPMKSFLTFVTLLSFDLKIVKIGCVLLATPMTRFLSRLVVLPVVASYITFVLGIRKVISPSSTRLKADLPNAIGSFCSVFFIPLTINVLSPFVCFDHPCGKASMVSSAATLCFDEDKEHITMVILALLSFIVLVLPFLTAVTYQTYRYKSHILQHDVEALDMCRFLFMRFKIDSYWYGCAVLMRNLLICLVPIVTKDGALQVVCLVFLLLSFVVIQAWFKPWRPHATKSVVLDANFIDSSLTPVCIILLMCGALATNFEARMKTIQIIGVFAFAVLCSIVGISMGTSAYHRINPSPFYKFFVAYHTDIASAQARLFKVMMTITGPWQTYNSADDLFDLDKLFDIVRCRTSYFLVWGTGDTMKNPWMAGKVSIALEVGVPTTLIKMPVFIQPSEEQLNNIEEYLDASRVTLAGFGIGTDVVQRCYRKLFDTSVTTHIIVEGTYGRKRLVDTCINISTTIMGKSSGSAPMNIPEPRPLEDGHREELRGTVLITSDPADDEATAAAALLDIKLTSEMVAREIPKSTGKMVCVSADFNNLTDEALLSMDDNSDGAAAQQIFSKVVRDSRVVLVLLSKSTLQSQTQLLTIIEAMATHGDTNKDDALEMELLPVKLPGFDFPAMRYFSEVLPVICPAVSQDESQRYAIENFFRRSVFPFNTTASETVLDMQVKELCDRIPQDANKWLASPRASLNQQDANASLQAFLTSLVSAPAELPKGISVKVSEAQAESF